MKILIGVMLVVGGFMAETTSAQSVSCPSCAVIDIRGSGDKDTQRQLIKACLALPKKTVRLGPDVDLDFTNFPQESLPITVGAHSSLISVAALDPEIPPASTGGAANLARTAPVVSCPTLDNSPGSARTSHSRGPVIRYGNIDPGKYTDLPGTHSLLSISCIPGLSDSEGSRISGFQLIGPSPDAQQRSNTGIKVDGCLDVEISNMEISGWGEAAIAVSNANLRNIDDPAEPKPIKLLIHDNFIHNNQYPEHDGHALGYGINTGLESWSRIYQNVFDNNKHAITAGFDVGGYSAYHNLVLKGGGHEDAWYEKYIHIFDVHGSENCDIFGHNNCGYAGNHFLFFENAFQYKKEIDIKIRGKPRNANPPTLIAGNVFARSDEQKAIDLNVPGNVVVKNNVYNVDTYGDYGVCDFDGDGVDDLFLATGVSWWFSSAGQFQWTHLNNQKFRRSDVRLGYFDADQRCDVLIETDPGHWFISSGGAPPLIDLGNFGAPLKEVQFGRFDAQVRDHRPNVTRQTTHAFWRRPNDEQWRVRPLSHLSHRDWQPVASSSFPLDQLRFGDFTGDGVTDVLAVVDGHWAISESATGSWRQINSSLGDPVANLFIANMDADDNIDDVLRVSSTATLDDFGATVKNTLTWWRSKNGTEPWQVWKTYAFSYPKDDADFVSPGYSFAGRFGAAHEGATMVTNTTRMGQFHSEVSRPVRASRDWLSVFPY
jgi:hypothetical protein